MSTRTLLVVLGLLSLACTGEKFGGEGAGDASVPRALTDDDEATDDGPSCGSEVCPVPACPPQRQFTRDGECCPTCAPPGVCSEGARCDVVDCPNPIEVGDGCCVCDDLRCEAGALACTDPSCVGAAQDHVGGGCCICGAALQCPEGQAACDNILCAGDVLYQQDGCCTCKEEACGAGSTKCEALACDEGERTEVGGGCCVCDVPPEPAECEDGTSPCLLLDCASTLVTHGNDCCSCGPSCDGQAGQEPCATIACEGTVTELGDGCCACADLPICAEGTADCSLLACPNAEVMEVSEGCCACSECSADTINCLTIVCEGEVMELGNGCCACAGGPGGNSCDDEVQEAYDRELQRLKDEGPTCTEASDCRLETVRTQCRLDCHVALHVDAAGTIVSSLEAWAAERCASCPEPVSECLDANDGVTARCVDASCVTASAP